MEVVTPASTQEEIQTMLGDDSESGKEERKKTADRLVEMVANLELFHSRDEACYAVLEVNGHREIHSLRSSSFKTFLAHRFYLQEKKVPHAQAVQDALATLQGRARFEGPERDVCVRVADREGRIYLDLGDDAWRAVEISPSGWDVVDVSPVAFRRPRGMLPLPEPLSGGSLDDLLRPFLNVVDDSSWRLVLVWILAALRPTGPYPILCLHGTQGAAKSSATHFLRALIDPSKAPLRGEPKELHTVMITARNSWVFTLDNASRLPGWLSDTLCRLATGGGFSTRELYTDSDEILFDATRPAILNGISELPSRGDLLDRSIIIECPTIPPERRRSAENLRQEFEKAQPLIVGALLDVLVNALRELPQVHAPSLPRMADFALFGLAVERALGWPGGSFLRSYEGNITGSYRLAIESSPVGEAIVSFAERETPWEGSPTALLEKLSASEGEHARRRDGWPKSPRGLTDAIKRLRPSLEREGIRVTFGRTGRQRLVCLEKV